MRSVEQSAGSHPRSRLIGWQGHAISALLLWSVPAAVSAESPIPGTYFCNVGGSFFFLTIQGQGSCTTNLAGLPRQPCSFSYRVDNRLVSFTSSDRSELKVYNIYYLPTGQRGAQGGRVGPGFEALNERVREGPPIDRGWCNLTRD